LLAILPPARMSSGVTFLEFNTGDPVARTEWATGIMSRRTDGRSSVVRAEPHPRFLELEPRLEQALASGSLEDLAAALRREGLTIGEVYSLFYHDWQAALREAGRRHAVEQLLQACSAIQDALGRSFDAPLLQRLEEGLRRHGLRELAVSLHDQEQWSKGAICQLLSDYLFFLRAQRRPETEEWLVEEVLDALSGWGPRPWLWPDEEAG